jgi:predicted transcriptional regulator
MRFTILISLLFLGVAGAQSPAPIIVQAANAANTATTATSTSTKSAAASADPQSIQAAIKQLEQIKAANDEVLAKQKAALERLDELQDAADQLRIFAKRG